jgi:hypothetical protein
MFNNSTLTSTPSAPAGTSDRPVPSREAYDLASSIIAALAEAMALDFDPRDGDWSDYGFMISLVASKLANAHPLLLNAMVEKTPL